MRVKYIKSEDLGVMESTVNLLLSYGWEREGSLVETSDGEYLITLCNWDRPLRGSERAMDIHMLSPRDVPVEVQAGTSVHNITATEILREEEPYPSEPRSR